MREEKFTELTFFT